jgi:predicted phage replisome organizer
MMAMADVKWIKIVTDVFDDEKILLIESMPEADAIIVIWFKLLCLAGKQNNSGVFMMGRMPYTDEMFSTIFRRPLNTVRMALRVFEQFGMIEIINNAVTIPNWGKHQNTDQIEAKNAYMKNYMREYRAKQKALSDGKANCKTNSKANVSEAEKIREEKEEDKKENKSVRETQHTLFEKLRPNYLFDDEMADKMSEWFTYKTEMKQTYKERGMSTLLMQVEKYTKKYGNKAVCELIDDSMANGWKGIIWERLEKKQPAKQTGRKEIVPNWMAQPNEKERLMKMMAEVDPELSARAEELKARLGK